MPFILTACFLILLTIKLFTAITVTWCLVFFPLVILASIWAFTLLLLFIIALSTSKPKTRRGMRYTR